MDTGYGYVYLISLDPDTLDDVDYRQDVWKIGMSEQNSYSRVNGYGPSTTICRFYRLQNPRECEKELISEFRKNFENVKGCEYFIGNVFDIMYIFDKVVCECNSKRVYDFMKEACNHIRSLIRYGNLSMDSPVPQEIKFNDKHHKWIIKKYNLSSLSDPFIELYIEKISDGICIEKAYVYEYGKNTGVTGPSYKFDEYEIQGYRRERI